MEALPTLSFTEKSSIKHEGEWRLGSASSEPIQ
jgi:hypothetical protein